MTTATDCFCDATQRCAQKILLNDDFICSLLCTMMTKYSSGDSFAMEEMIGEIKFHWYHL